MKTMAAKDDFRHFVFVLNKLGVEVPRALQTEQQRMSSFVKLCEVLNVWIYSLALVALLIQKILTGTLLCTLQRGKATKQWSKDF
jgi:hypothetical protein